MSLKYVVKILFLEVTFHEKVYWGHFDHDVKIKQAMPNFFGFPASMQSFILCNYLWTLFQGTVSTLQDANKFITDHYNSWCTHKMQHNALERNENSAGLRTGRG